MTMTCKELPEAVADVLGGEATADREALVARHVSECSACRVRHSGLAAVMERARAVAVPEPSAAYWTSYMGELRRRIAVAAERPRGLASLLDLAAMRWLRPAALALAMASLLLVSLRSPAPGGVGTVAAVETLAIGDLATVHGLSSGLDRLEPFDPLGLDQDDGAEAAAEALLAPAPTADLFDFFNLTEELSSAERDRLLQTLLGGEFHG